MDSYLETIPKRLAYVGSTQNGEIIIDQERTDKEGFGVLYEDRFIRLIRDPVVFPDGSTGAYIRILNQSESNGSGGAVIIPVFGDQVAFVRLFRHATRSWEIELPRGFQDPGFSELENVNKEVKEELGVEACKVEKVGDIKPNTGLLSSDVAVYVAKLVRLPELDASRDVEVHSRRCVPLSELDRFIVEAPIKCSISISAIYLAKLSGHISS